MAIEMTELRRVIREQEELYDAMMRSIWGDRITLAATAASVAGMGMGLLFNRSWGARFTGTLLYAMAASLQLYVAMRPKPGARGEVRGESPLEAPRAA